LPMMERGSFVSRELPLFHSWRGHLSVKQRLTSRRKVAGDSSMPQVRQGGISTYSHACQLTFTWLRLICLNPSRAVLRGTQAFTVLLSLCDGPVQTMSVYRKVSHHSNPQ
jgi:hypothetical protein